VNYASDSGERGQACCTKQKCSTKHPAYPHDSHNSGEHVHCIFALYMRSLLQNSARSINLQKDLCLKAMSVGKGAPHINLNPNKQWALLHVTPCCLQFNLLVCCFSNYAYTNIHLDIGEIRKHEHVLKPTKDSLHNPFISPHGLPLKLYITCGCCHRMPANMLLVAKA